MQRPYSRRALLRAIPVAGGLALAGCDERTDDTDGESPTGTDSPTPSPTGPEVTVTTTRTAARTTTPSPSPTDSPTASPTLTATPTPSPSPTPTPVPDPAVVVTDLTVDAETVRQGAEVTVRVELENRGGPGAPHTVRLSGGDGVLRRTRVPTDTGEPTTATFTVRCDRAGTREFTAGERRASVAVERSPASFVAVDGRSFVVDGERFPMVGANNAYLHHKSHKTVDEVFADAAAMGLDTVRLLVNGGGTEVGYCREFACGQSQYGLQPAPGAFDEASFRRLDYAVASAKRHGIRLIPSLITRSPGGISAYVEWVDGADSEDEFYTNAECRRLYREYLETVLTRTNTYTGLEYREDPTIALWELANEPELSDQPYGAALQDWVAEMAAHAKSLDSNHPVSVGIIGWNDRGNEDDYLACFEADAVDAASTHLYYDTDGVEDWVERHATGVHERLDKPLYVGEFGWDATRTEADYDRQLRNRNEGFREWYDQFATHDVAGSLFWSLIGHLDEGSRYPDHDGFGVYRPEDPSTVEVVRAAAERFGAADGGAR